MLLALPLAGHAQDDGGFDDFLNAEMNSFDKFIDDANKEFVNFLRNPWVELEGKKPIEQKEKPKPVEPVERDVNKDPVPTTPKEIDIQAILDLTSSEGKQKPIVKVKDVDQVPSERPDVGGKKKPTVVIVKEKDPVVETPVDEPVVQTPIDEPVVQTPIDEPIVQTPVDEPVVIPTPTPKPRPSSSPLYNGGNDRSKITFGGRNFYVSSALAGTCRLSNLKEKAVADAYERMYRSDYKLLLNDCEQIRKDLRLNDWGTFTLVRTISDNFCSNANESVVMQQFLLNELGYKAKMARKDTNDKMLLFVATDCMVYGHPYFEMNGYTYYNINSKDACAFYLCEKDAPKAKNRLDMHLGNAPLMDGATARSTHKAKGSSGATVTTDVPKALVEFYKSYPQCDFTVYAQAPVNSSVRNTVLSSLRPYIQGKSDVEAANILINFVQTGFEYATDDQQFGYEKPFFVEELLFYPFCDCEDRSIFYSFLIKNLLGLDVVLLDYPNHIATAVCFKEQVNGDYVVIDGKRYTICDPTYIGANIGMAMPSFKSTAPKVIKF